MLVKLNLSGHENETLKAQGYETHILHVDLADSELPTKVVEFLKPYINSGDTVQVVLPGLAPLGAIVLTAIHGLSGHFPTLTPLIRGEGGAGFVPGSPLDLQDFRNEVGRTSREGVVVL
jgi:hypothetical protein